MSAYENIDSAAAGLLYGLGNRTETWKAKEEIAFGKAVYATKGDSINVTGYYKDVAKLVFDADFVASNSIVATIDGVATDPVVFNTDQATTLADLIDAIDALEGVEAVADATDVNGRTILIRKKEVQITASAVVTGGASQAVASATYGSSLIFVGVAASTQKEDGKYLVNESVNVVHDGKINVLVKSNVSANSAASVLDSGANKGEFAATGEDTGAKFRTSAVADGLAVVEVDGQKGSEYSDIDFN